MSKFTSQDQSIAQAFPVQGHSGGGDGSVVQAQVVHQPQMQASMINERGGRDFLSAHGWPDGLQDQVIKTAYQFPIRYFICDNSGSMSAGDGKRFEGSGNSTKLVNCSRWSELTDSLRFHATLSEKLGVISDFRLLNGSHPIRVGPHELVGDNLPALFHEFEKSPQGGTPLCYHISRIAAEVYSMKDQLLARRERVCLIIATDGESSDGDIATAMRPLEHLPVWVVIRLCTDEEKIVNYWNNFESQLEIEIDVLDDLSGEALEVHSKNPWLTYGLPLHRLREFGIPLKELDLIDEQVLTPDQIRTVSAAVLGGRADDYPHPQVSKREFVSKVNSRNPSTWNPVTKKMDKWINTNYISGDSSCTIM